MPRRGRRIVLSGYLAVAAVDLVAELLGWAGVALACRLLLMPLLIGWCWLSSARRRDAVLTDRRLMIMVLVALGWCWLGDLTTEPVLLKIVFFLVAQILYLVAFSAYRRSSVLATPPLLITYAILLLAPVAVVAATAGSLAIPVAVYGLCLAAMTVLATGVHRLTGLGAVLFFLSDLVLAAELFVAPGAVPAALALNMALYLPGQLLIVLGVLRRVAADAGPVPAG